MRFKQLKSIYLKKYIKRIFNIELLDFFIKKSTSNFIYIFALFFNLKKKKIPLIQ